MPKPTGVVGVVSNVIWSTLSNPIALSTYDAVSAYEAVVANDDVPVLSPSCNP